MPMTRDQYRAWCDAETEERRRFAAEGRAQRLRQRLPTGPGAEPLGRGAFAAPASRAEARRRARACRARADWLRGETAPGAASFLTALSCAEGRLRDGGEWPAGLPRSWDEGQEEAKGLKGRARLLEGKARAMPARRDLRVVA